MKAKPVHRRATPAESLDRPRRPVSRAAIPPTSELAEWIAGYLAEVARRMREHNAPPISVAALHRTLITEFGDAYPLTHRASLYTYLENSHAKAYAKARGR
jgi:hypothetical protein